MKILYWTGLFWPHIGGVEVLSMQLLPELQKKGYELIVLTSQSNPNIKTEDEFKGIPIYRVPFHKGIANNNLQEIKKTKQKVKEIINTFGPDLIHLNSIDNSIFFLPQEDDPLNKIPILFTVHALPPFLVNENTLLMKILNSAHWITTASQAMLSVIQNLATEKKDRISLIYYGLKTPGVEFVPPDFISPRLLCIGRVVQEKGFDLVINSFAEVLIQFPKARLIIAGDGPAKSELEKQVKDLNVSHAVKFVGWVSPEDIPRLINSCSVIIVPSRWEEPFGLVALQAAQMSRPVIAAQVGGLPEIVVHNKTGLLFEKDNHSSLMEKINFLLGNPETAIQMGTKAQMKAIEDFGFDSFVGEYDKLYQNIFEIRLNNNAAKTF
jgi:glycosyltransferase involved in cell wall biosynthesis